MKIYLMNSETDERLKTIEVSGPREASATGTEYVNAFDRMGIDAYWSDDPSCARPEFDPLGIEPQVAGIFRKSEVA